VTSYDKIGNYFQTYKKIKATEEQQLGLYCIFQTCCLTNCCQLKTIFVFVNKYHCSQVS